MFPKTDERSFHWNTFRDHIGFASGQFRGIESCTEKIEKIQNEEFIKLKKKHGKNFNPREFEKNIETKINSLQSVQGFGKGILPDISFIISREEDINKKMAALMLYDIRVKVNEIIQGVRNIGFECTIMPAIPGFSVNPNWGIIIARLYNGLLRQTFENSKNTGIGKMLASVSPVVILPDVDWSFNPLFIEELIRLGLNIETERTDQGGQAVDFVKRVTL